MDTLTFLSRILPRDGFAILAELRPYTDKATGITREGWRYTTFTDKEQMAEAIDQFNQQNRTIYHACSSFGDWYKDERTGKNRIRTQQNVAKCRSLYDDIDIGKEGCYPTKKEAAQAVKQFIKDTGLPAPLVVDSGGGLHLYWPLTEDISVDEWRQLSAQKRRLTAHFGLKVDTAVDMDSARVLRPVGSMNHKYDPPRLVKALNDPAPTTPEAMRERLDAAIDAHQPPMFHHEGRPKLPNAFAGAIEYPPSYAEQVSGLCQVVHWFKETGAGGSEPLWWQCVGILKFCEDGPEKIHEWSAKYDRYDADETQKKIDSWQYGPPTCEKVKSIAGEHCAGCQRTCKSPIQLGHLVEAKPVDLGTIVEAPQIESGMAKEDLLKLVFADGVRAQNGGLYRMVTDPDTGEVKSIQFSNTVFYGTGLVRNEEQEWSLVVEYVARHGELRSFAIPTSTIAAGDKLASALAAHTIFLTGKFGKVFAMDHLTTSVLQLQYHRQEVVTEDAFGWTPDGEGFIIGNTLITADGEKPVRLSEHVKRGGMDIDYGVAGDRANWVRLVDDVYNRPGAEMYQFAFLVSAASPLIQMVGIDGFHGVPVAYTGEGGRGKTTVCELACSIWGRGELFKQSSNKGGTTINGLLAKTAIHRHLPWVMDELTGQKIEEISDMFYALSNGQNKIRLGANGSFAGKILKWDMFSFITGNMDVTGMLANLDRQMAEAVSVRCFEVKVPDDINETVFKGVNFKTLVDVELRKNYGVVGRLLLRAYIKNRAKIVALVHKLRQEFQPNTADETRERFYVDLICFALAAGKIMQKLDLVRFDLDAIRRWAFQNVKALRRARTERQLTASDLAGEFISWLHDKTIITKHIVDMRRGIAPEAPIDQMRGDPMARKATVDKRFIISAGALRVWGKENNISPNVVREALDRSGYILHISGREPSGAFNTRLGAGTTRATGLARCFELDYAKIHGYETEHADNVVALHQPVAEQVSEVAA